MIPDIFVGRHVTTGMLGIAILTIVYSISWGWRVKVLKVTSLTLLVFFISMLLFFTSCAGVALTWHDLIEYVTFVLLFFVCSGQECNEECLKHYYFIVSLVAVGMGFWGVLQYLNVVQIYSMVEPVTGSFENPAGIAMFLSALFPFSVYFMKQRGVCCKIWGRFASLLIILVVLLSGSRTGSLVIVLICVSSVVQKIVSIQWRARIKRILFLCLILCVVLLFFMVILLEERFSRWSNINLVVFVGYVSRPLVVRYR